jgi:hypothetical protein
MWKKSMGRKGGVFGSSLFLKIVSDEVTCGDHSRPSEKQLHRGWHWIYVIADKRSKCICSHNHENSWDKDRNFGQPFHTQVTPGRQLKLEKPEKISIGE